MTVCLLTHDHPLPCYLIAWSRSTSLSHVHDTTWASVQHHYSLCCIATSFIYMQLIAWATHSLIIFLCHLCYHLQLFDHWCTCCREKFDKMLLGSSDNTESGSNERPNCKKPYSHFHSSPLCVCHIAISCFSYIGALSAMILHLGGCCWKHLMQGRSTRIYLQFHVHLALVMQKRFIGETMVNIRSQNSTLFDMYMSHVCALNHYIPTNKYR